jgi:hypothetical protein
MKTMEKKPLNDPMEQLRKDALRHQRDDDLRDDDMISDKPLPGWDNADEWDREKMDSELDRRDLEDDDEANFDVHGVKNDKFGSLGASIKNEADPDPNEIPEEGEANREDIDYPDDDRMEQAKDDEVTYHEPKGVEPPNTKEAPEKKVATLDSLDPTFTDDTHERQTKRMVDHEPGAGSKTGEHGAYNL